MRHVSFVILAAVTMAGFCSASSSQNAKPQQSAPDLMIRYGCPTCHVIPHVPGAVGKVGPSLESVWQRSYVAGSISNTPGNLVQWIMHPQHFQPGTAMPEMGVTERDARRIAAFLDANR